MNMDNVTKDVIDLYKAHQKLKNEFQEKLTEEHKRFENFANQCEDLSVRLRESDKTVYEKKKEIDRKNAFILSRMYFADSRFVVCGPIP